MNEAKKKSATQAIQRCHERMMEDGINLATDSVERVAEFVAMGDEELAAMDPFELEEIVAEWQLTAR